MTTYKKENHESSYRASAYCSKKSVHIITTANDYSADISQRKLQTITNNNPSQMRQQKLQITANKNPLQRVAIGRLNDVAQLGKTKGVGNGGTKRQGHKSQRDKKYGKMNDPVYGEAFIKWLHLKKQKEHRRDDYDAKEVDILWVQFCIEAEIQIDNEVPPQNRNFDLPPSDSDDEGYTSITVN